MRASIQANKISPLNYFSLCLLYDIVNCWFMFWSYVATVVLLFSLRLCIFFSFISFYLNFLTVSVVDTNPYNSVCDIFLFSLCFLTDPGSKLFLGFWKLIVLYELILQMSLSDKKLYWISKGFKNSLKPQLNPHPYDIYLYNNIFINANKCPKNID